MPPASGTRLGPYEIQSLLGAGGTGELYRARDSRLDRTVAIKVLAANFSNDPVHTSSEAKVISSLNHPHICTLHGIGSKDGTVYLVMEFLEGESLARCLLNSIVAGWSADGRFLVLNSVFRNLTPLTLVSNWTADLKP